MKKKLYSLILFISIGMSFGSSVFALVNTDIPSPQLEGTTVSVTGCDDGDTWLQYDATDTLVVSNSCSGGAFSEGVAQIDTIVECDSEASLATCDGATLEDAIADMGYIGQQEYVFTDSIELPTVGTEDDPTVSYYDWLVMNLFILFFLSLIVFLPVIKSLFPHRDLH